MAISYKSCQFARNGLLGQFVIFLSEIEKMSPTHLILVGHDHLTGFPSDLFILISSGGSHSYSNELERSSKAIYDDFQLKQKSLVSIVSTKYFSL